MCEEVSPYALEVIQNLNSAIQAKDVTALTDLLFDAECEGLGNQIDIPWYEQVAAKLSAEDQYE